MNDDKLAKNLKCLLSLYRENEQLGNCQPVFAAFYENDKKSKGTKNSSLCPYFCRFNSRKEDYLQPDYTFFFKKISGIFNKY